MSKGRDNGQALQGAGPSAFDSWITPLFLLFLCSFCCAVAFLLYQEGKGRVILIAIAAGALVWFLELLETRYLAAQFPRWRLRRGYVTPAVVITLVTLIAFLPTLNIYFLVDDFAFVHSFHNLSVSEFLRLLHTDLGQFVWGDTRQEFRPLYSLYYVAAYHAWGLRPWGYHVTGILMHIVVAFLVFLIAKNLAPDEPRRAAFAGLLFAVQPPHAQALSLMVGLVAESLPAVFYLTAFLCFVHFRSSGLARYLAISTLALAGCLLTKESAVTLPIMLVSYDLFRILAGEESISSDPSRSRWPSWRRLALPYAIFGALLLIYLAWRRVVFASYLREAGWGSHAGEAVASRTGFWLHCTHFVARVWKLQAFNFQSLFPYPSVALGLVLGLFAVWGFSLQRRRHECRRSVLLVLYFGLVWYCISNLPYLIEGYVVYHLYLPAAGACIAIAFLVVPTCREPAREARLFRLVGGVFLVGISATQLWKGNREYGRIGEMSARMAGELARAAKGIPKGSLVVVWPAKSYLVASGWGEEILPFALQQPFASNDLYSGLRIVEHPDMSCCGVAEWWQKTKPVLASELARAPDEQVETYLLLWDGQRETFQQKKGALTRRFLRACATRSLGRPVETVDSLGEADAEKLVEAFSRLVPEGNCVSVQR